MGELGTLEKHLNQNSQDDKEIEGCEFAEIECSYCSGIIVRSNLLHHKNELVTSVHSVVNIAMIINQIMRMSFTTTSLCVAITQYDAQMSVECFLNDKTLMATYKWSAL